MALKICHITTGYFENYFTRKSLHH